MNHNKAANQALRNQGIRQSRSRKTNAWDQPIMRYRSPNQLFGWSRGCVTIRAGATWGLLTVSPSSEWLARAHLAYYNRDHSFAAILCFCSPFLLTRNRTSITKIQRSTVLLHPTIHTCLYDHYVTCHRIFCVWVTCLGTCSVKSRDSGICYICLVSDEPS
jgi:hypothetical protein